MPVQAPSSSLETSADSEFDDAVRDFQSEIGDHELFDFNALHTVHDLNNEIQKTQEEQGRKRQLRNMQMMARLLDRLDQYSGVVESFVQVKPAVLALIWGPLKFLILVSKNYVQGFDKVIRMTKKLGDCLPQFGTCKGLFPENRGVRDILYLFYKDMLEFYLILLKLFQVKGWKILLEALWPRYAAKIDVVMASIENHKLLLDREVTFADIRDARDARSRALKEYEQNQTKRETQNFGDCRVSLSPHLYDGKLDKILKDSCKDTCGWLEDDADFQRWLNGRRKSTAFLWLSGIPGAGKSHLAASFITKKRSSGNTILFAFLSFQHQETTTVVSVIHSLIFQLLYKHQHLRPALIKAYENDYTELQSYVEYNQQLLTDLLQCIEAPYIVIDGLDEIAEKERQFLLKRLLQISNQCPELKVLISSREEKDISTLLYLKALSLPIRLKNAEDIQKYFDYRVKEWLNSLNIQDDEYFNLEKLVRSIPSKAEGMFLYARLVIEHLSNQADLEAIRKEVDNLPTGLNEAYGRIILRIENMNLPGKSVASRILSWLACTKAPLQKREIMQALMVQEGDDDLVAERRIVQDIRQLCGPIIEVDGEIVSFVHSTARKYLMDIQSGPFIREVTAHREIAHTCMTYLMFICFDLKVSKNELDDALLKGQCVLQAYATSHWLYHVKQSIRDDTDSAEFKSLRQKISKFLARRNNTGFDRKKARVEGTVELNPFQKEEKHIYETLCLVNSAEALELPEHLKFSKDARLKYSGEPLTLRQCWDEIHDRWEALVCHSDHQMIMEENYGERIFRCNHLMCNSSRIGFRAKVERDQHARFHKRSFKCGYPSCKFAKIGFFSQNQLTQHTEVLHMGSVGQRSNERATVDLDQVTLEQAMLDAVELGETEYLNVILDRIHQPPLNFLMHLAYLRGSKVAVLDTLDRRGAAIDDRESLGLLIHKGDRDPRVPVQIWSAMTRIREEYNIYQSSAGGRGIGVAEGPQTALTEAIEGGSVEVVRWLLEHGGDVREPILDHKLSVTPLDYLFARQLFRSKDKHLRRPLMQDIVQLLLESGSSVENGSSLHNLLQCQIHPEEQSTYLDMAKLLLKYGSSVRKDALHYVIGCNYSWELAQLLIENGAEIEIPYTLHDPKAPTPLMRCLTANHKKAAEFAKFLLESGAKTQLKADDLSRGKEFKLDPKKFAKWTGTSWDDVVASAQRSEAAAALPPVDFNMGYPRPR